MGFYRGNGASVAGIIPYVALHYMTFEQYHRCIILNYHDIGWGLYLILWQDHLLEEHLCFLHIHWIWFQLNWLTSAIQMKMENMLSVICDHSKTPLEYLKTTLS